MKQSELFTRVFREAPKEEESTNGRLLTRAGFIDKTMAGVYNFLPLGLRVLKKIEAIIRQEMRAIGGEEVLLSALQPKANWETTGRWQTVDNLFKFTSFYSKTDYALGPTHEEILTPLVKKYVSSYKDFPISVFQIQTKFRDEERPKSGLLRSREFLMKDLYSFHKDEADLDRYYDRVTEAYWKIWRRAGIAEHTYFTFASGGTFSKYSHEFQTLTEAGEDIVYVCEKCRLAVNKEIIDKNRTCLECGSKNLEPKKAVEVGNIFKLKNRFSSSFGLRYKNKDGKEENVMMGCYGIGLYRLMGTAVEIFHDDQGIIWPEQLAPFRFHLIELKSGLAKKIYEKLNKEEVEVLYDDREASPGEKLVEADLVGIPYRLVVSEKTGEKIELKERGRDRIKLIDYETIRKL